MTVAAKPEEPERSTPVATEQATTADDEEADVEMNSADQPKRGKAQELDQAALLSFPKDLLLLPIAKKNDDTLSNKTEEIPAN